MKKLNCNFRPEEIHSIVGVHNGVLIILGKDEGKRILCTAKLPERDVCVKKRLCSATNS